MNLHAHAMIALVAQHDAEHLYHPDHGDWPSMDACFEAERLYDLAFEAQERATPEAMLDVERWICGEGEIPKKEERAA